MTTSGFQFRFKQLLDYNTKLEEEAKMKLGQAIAESEVEKNLLRQMILSYNNAVDEWNESMKQFLRIMDIQIKSSQIQWRAEQISSQQNIVLKAEEKVEKCRKTLIEAKKETRKFEKIRERDLGVYLEREKKMETASVDQFVSHRNATR